MKLIGWCLMARRAGPSGQSSELRTTCRCSAWCTLLAEKDHGNLLSALAQVVASGRDFRLVVVGTGMTADNAELADLVRASGIADRLHLLGRRDDVAAVMNGLDVHILSSASEGFPNVVAEAMCCGTPCVTTEAGDVPLIVGDAGWIVPTGDPAALARAVTQALGAMSHRASWSHRQRLGRDHVIAHFGIGEMVAAYHRVWGR